MLRKILIIVLVVVVVLGVGLGYFLLYQEKENQIRLREETELKLKLAEMESQKLRNDIIALEGKLQETKVELETQLTENQRMVKTIESLNETLKNAESQVSLLTQERDVLLARLEREELRVKELQNKLTSLEKERASVPEGKKVKLEDIKVEEKVSQVQATVESIPTKLSTPATISAEVMAYNKEYKFIVINKGERDGIILGTAYSVLMGGNKIGRIRTDRVYDSMSVLDLLEGGSEIKEGVSLELLQEK